VVLLVSTADLTFALLGLGTSALAGLLMAAIARRIHPGLPLLRMWLFYSLLIALFVAFVIVVALY
jgi:hypothetical protein